MEVILDTNAYSDWIRKGIWNEEISHATRIFLPIIVLGELEHGFLNCKRYAENREVLERFLAQAVVDLCEVNEAVSRVYGNFCLFLQRAGTPIPTNDVWIAATAHVSGATLLSDDGHFDFLPQVKRMRSGE